MGTATIANGLGRSSLNDVLYIYSKCAKILELDENEGHLLLV